MGYNGNMSKRQVLMILGVWVIILPFLGFPSGWDRTIAVVAGFLIVAIAYSLGPKVKTRAEPSVPYVEHRADSVGPARAGSISSANSPDKK